MDEQLRARAAARKPGRRRHAAATSRILTAGLSTSAVFALIAAFGMTAPGPARATAPSINRGASTTTAAQPRPLPGRATPQAAPHTTTRGS